MNAANLNLRALRAQMDEVDDRIVDLFETRMQLSAQIAQIKRENKLPRIDEDREREIIRRQVRRVEKPLDFYIPLLYDTLFELSRTYQVSVLDSE